MTGTNRADSEAMSGAGRISARGATLLARFDPLIPPAIVAGGGSDLIRGRMTAAAMASAAVLYGLNGLYLLVSENQLGVAVVDLVCAAVLLASFRVFRGLRHQDLFAALFLFVALGQIVFLWLASAGSNLGALFGLSAVVLASVVLASWRFGLGVTLVASAVVGASAVLLPLEAAASPFQGHVYRDAFLLILGVGGISTIYDWTRELATRDADLARKRAEASERLARHATETLASVADISGRLQRARGDALEKEIDAGVAIAAKIAGAGRSVLKVFDNRDAHTLARHASHDHEDDFDARDPELLARCAWSVGKLAAGEIIALADRDEMPPEAAAERELLAAHDVRSWLVIPVRIGPNRFGYFSFDSGEMNDWSTVDIEPLQLLGEILAAAATQRFDEVAREESEEKFQKAFSANPDGMLLADLEANVVVDCNDRLLELAEVEREWMVGRPLDELADLFDTIPDAPSNQVIRELGRALASGSSHEEEMRIRSGNGTRVYVLSAAVIEIGGARNLLTTVHDISERRELESQLRQAQKMEAVGRLAGGVAHDFNNMLTVIQGHAEALREPLEGRHDEELDAIRDAVDRSAALTRRLLTFSRRQMLHPTRVDLGELVARVETMLRSVIGEDIQLQVRVGEAPTVIEADASQMEQALLNLVVNARDAVVAGGRIDIATERIDVGPEEAARLGIDPGTYARLCIADDGCGMEEDILGRVLDPFFTTKEEGKGSGLGLSMVDGFVRQSGGTLDIASRPAQGTTVDAFFPAVDLAATEHTTDDHVEGAPGATGTVLLVEDEAALRQLARNALESAGHTVIEAVDGIDALERAAAYDEPIDVLLTDAVMPRLGGFDLADRLEGERPGLRVLVMSGYPEGSRGGDGPPRGFEILPKPFSPSQLRKEVSRLLKDPGRA